MCNVAEIGEPEIGQRQVNSGMLKWDGVVAVRRAVSKASSLASRMARVPYSSVGHCSAPRNRARSDAMPGSAAELGVAVLCVHALRMR